MEIDAKQLEYFATRGIKNVRLAFHYAQRELQNAMAFGVREEAIKWGIPAVMTVRNPTILRALLGVTKATRANGDVASVRQFTRDRFSGLPEEEFGHGVMHRHPATKAARGGTNKPQLPLSSKFVGNIIKPMDIEIAHATGSETQIVAVFLAQLQRKGTRKPFIMPTMGKWKGGLKKFGGPRPVNLAAARPTKMQLRMNPNMKPSRLLSMNIKKQEREKQVIGLRYWGRETKDVKRRPWMKPSIDKWIREHNQAKEWTKACDKIITFRQRKGWDTPPGPA